MSPGDSSARSGPAQVSVSLPEKTAPKCHTRLKVSQVQLPRVTAGPPTAHTPMARQPQSAVRTGPLWVTWHSYLLPAIGSHTHRGQLSVKAMVSLHTHPRPAGLPALFQRAINPLGTHRAARNRKPHEPWSKQFLFAQSKNREGAAAALAQLSHEALTDPGVLPQVES